MTNPAFQKMTLKITPLARKFGMQYVGLFGSRARGDSKKDSDFDFLVRFRKPVSLLKVIEAEREFSECLNQKVDLVTHGALNPMLIDSILSDAITVYEKK